MDILIKLFYFLIDLLLPLTIGYFFHQRNSLSETAVTKMININILILSPLLSILSFWVLPLTWNLIWLPIFGILLSLIPGFFAYFISRNKYASPLDTGSYLLSAMLSNIGTLGGLCAFIFFGEAGFAYTQLVTVLQNAVLFLFCYPMAQYYYLLAKNDGRQHLSFISLFFTRNQLPLVGLLIGYILYSTGLPRPALLGAMFNPLVHITAWTALMPVGYSIDFSSIKKYYVGILDHSPIKFIITPVLSYLIARQVFNDITVTHTVVILASTPTAINAVIAAKVHDLNVHISTASFVVTTVLFLVIVFPVIFCWLTFS